jgi:DNA-binding response OmpR family regulator
LLAVLPSNETYITNCIKSGLNDYIKQEKLNHDCLLCRIERLLHFTDEYILEVYSRGNIYLNPDTQEAYISGKKIDLTESETKILKYMIEKDRPCTSEELRICLHTTVKEKSVGVLICRLMKKMKYILGYSIVKNRYKKGYYIDY